MGASGITKLIITRFPGSCYIRHPNSYRGATVVVDCPNVLYRFIIAIRNNGSDLTNENGKMTSHLYAILNNALYFIKKGIKPLYVFDGKAPTIKKDVLRERKKIKDRANEKYLNDTEKNISDFKKSFTLQEYHIKESQQLLKALGIPYVRAPQEAESQGAGIVASDENIYGIVSEDSDSLIFGATKLLKNFTGKSNKVIELDLDKILENFKNEANIVREKSKLYPINEFPYEKFVEFCSFTSEYCPQIKGVNLSLLFDLYVKSDLDMNRTINYLKKNSTYFGKRVDIPENFLNKLNEAKQYYLEAKIIDPSKIDKDWKKPNYEEVINLLCRENSFNFKVIDQKIREIIYYYELYISKE